MEAGSDKAMIQYGAVLMLTGDQAKGEELIVQAMTKRPKDFWGWTAAGGAYLGVMPML